MYVALILRFTRLLFKSHIPKPPNVPLFRALWSLLDGIWGLLKGSWGCWDIGNFINMLQLALDQFYRARYVQIIKVSTLIFSIP